MQKLILKLEPEVHHSKCRIDIKCILHVSWNNLECNIQKSAFLFTKMPKVLDSVVYIGTFVEVRT